MAREEGADVGDSSEDLKEAIRSQSDEELYRLLYEQAYNYTPEAIQIATEEFSRRNLDEGSIRRLVADGESAPGGPKKTVGSKQSPMRVVWSVFALLCLLGYAIRFVRLVAHDGYGALDSAGSISHQQATMISVRSDWIAGESKECRTNASDDGNVLSGLSCDDGPEHEMSVTFYGRKVQPEYRVVDWRCKREETSFTCFQMGGEQ